MYNGNVYMYSILIQYGVYYEEKEDKKAVEVNSWMNFVGGCRPGGNAQERTVVDASHFRISCRVVFRERDVSSLISSRRRQLSFLCEGQDSCDLWRIF